MASPPATDESNIGIILGPICVALAYQRTA